MTKVLIASDSFKGSASSSQVAEYIAKGIKKVDATIDELALPLNESDAINTLVIILASFRLFS